MRRRLREPHAAAAMTGGREACSCIGASGWTRACSPQRRPAKAGGGAAAIDQRRTMGTASEPAASAAPVTLAGRVELAQPVAAVSAAGAPLRPDTGCDAPAATTLVDRHSKRRCFELKSRSVAALEPSRCVAGDVGGGARVAGSCSHLAPSDRSSGGALARRNENGSGPRRGGRPPTQPSITCSDGIDPDSRVNAFSSASSGGGIEASRPSKLARGLTPRSDPS